MNTQYIVGGASVTAAQNASIKDNLYMHVNGAWLEQATIPADKPVTGGFQDLADDVEKTLMHDYQAYHDGKFTAPNPMFAEAMKLHTLASDFTKRDADGITPLKPLIAQVLALKNLKQYDEQLGDWLLNDMPLPFYVSVSPDWKDTTRHAVFVEAPSLILPDKTYYADNNPAGPQLLKVWAQMSQQLLQKCGFTADQAHRHVENALAFDRALVPYVMSSEEAADYPKQYNPQSFAKFISNSHFLSLDNLLNTVLPQQPQQVIVTNPKFFQALDQIINDHTFEQLKSWLLIDVVNSFSGYLSEELRQLSGMFNRALVGSQQTISQAKHAYRLTTSVFSQVIGDYYGRKYFGEAAKTDVTAMVQKMIEIYKKRLQNNNWLSPATRDKAILKLDKIVIKVGYPDKIKPIYQKFHVKTAAAGGTLLENILHFNKISIADNLAKFNQDVDRSIWGMPAQMVNAMYDPSRNDITFPAAILQAPFYSLQQSASANYGGIGAVIAHEISHAFDNNGAQFDELGNLNNWWTKDDYAHFKQLTQAMIDEFDGIAFAGGKVNGKLVVSENVADLGGLSCALEATKHEEHYNLKEFFINWATIWRMKARPQYQQMLLAADVHAPHELRANVQPQNFAEFYETFDIHENDGMWLAPEKRVQIW